MKTINNIYDKWIISAPKQLNAGLTIIKKIKNKNDHIILLGGNINNGLKKFEMLGGHFETSDVSALHTGTREFIEELFNLKLTNDKIDKLVKKLINNNHIIHQLTQISDKSASYFANFKTLELIYNYVYYNKYQIVEPLDIEKFIIKRNSDFKKCKKSDGLCEIEFISVIYLSKTHLLNLRNFSYEKLNQLRIQLL